MTFIEWWKKEIVPHTGDVTCLIQRPIAKAAWHAALRYGDKKEIDSEEKDTWHGIELSEAELGEEE